MYFLETLQVRAPCHGGVLYSFWYWWNVVWICYEFFKYWKKKCDFFCYFQHLKRKIWCKKNWTNFSIFSTLKKRKENIENIPFTYWLNGRWFLQIVDRDSGNLYPIYPLFPCSDFLSQKWGWLGGGGGVMCFLHFMLFPTFLEFHLMFSLCFFLY